MEPSDLDLAHRRCKAGEHTAICQIVGIDKWGDPVLWWSCSKCPVEGGYIAWNPSMGEWESIEAEHVRIFGTRPEARP